jgi:hypothetical protein
MVFFFNPPLSLSFFISLVLQISMPGRLVQQCHGIIGQQLVLRLPSGPVLQCRRHGTVWILCHRCVLSRQHHLGHGFPMSCRHLHVSHLAVPSIGLHRLPTRLLLPGWRGRAGAMPSGNVCQRQQFANGRPWRSLARLCAVSSRFDLCGGQRRPHTVWQRLLFVRRVGQCVPHVCQWVLLCPDQHRASGHGGGDVPSGTVLSHRHGPCSRLANQCLSHGLLLPLGHAQPCALCEWHVQSQRGHATGLRLPGVPPRPLVWVGSDRAHWVVCARLLLHRRQQ